MREELRKKRNLCWRCKNWDKCFDYRYYGKKQDYMKQTWEEEWVLIGADREKVIYVSKCDKFDEELQPEEIKHIKKT